MFPFCGFFKFLHDALLYISSLFDIFLWLLDLGVKLSGSGAMPDLSSIQAKVMAQAQAISAALAQKNAQAAAANHNSSSADVDRNKLKSLVDKIPTER